MKQNKKNTLKARKIQQYKKRVSMTYGQEQRHDIMIKCPNKLF